MQILYTQFRQPLGGIILFFLLIFNGCDTHVAETDDIRVQSSSHVSQAPVVGDRVQVITGGANLFDRPNGTLMDTAPAGAAGVLTRLKGGWAEVDFDDTFAGSFLLEGQIEPEDSNPPVNQPPVAGFTFSAVNLNVSFTDTSSDDNGVTSWAWDFGDGGTSTSQHPSHVYSVAGTYSVSLTVSDAEGEIDVITKSVTVSEGGTGGSGPVLVGLFGCSHAIGLVEGINIVMPELWTPSADAIGGYGGNTIDDYANFLMGVWGDFDGMLSELQAAAFNDPTAIPLIIYQPCARGRNPDTVEPSELEKDWIEIIANEVSTRVAGAFDYTFIVIPQPDYDPAGTCRKVGANTPTAMFNLGQYANTIGLADPSFNWSPLSLSGGEIDADNCHASEAGKIRQANDILNDWLLPTYGE